MGPAFQMMAYTGRQLHFEMSVVSINTVQESEYPIFMKGMVKTSRPAPNFTELIGFTSQDRRKTNQILQNSENETKNRTLLSKTSQDRSQKASVSSKTL
jgi:hypothetical protein